VRIILAAGKTGSVIISLPFNSFEFFERSKGKMIVAPGKYEILYGNSSDAKDLKTSEIKVL
jgi:beta-glucosidase